MNKYPKIQTVYKRDPKNKYRTLLTGQYALPELEYLANNDWVWTEKIHGTNIRVMWDAESSRLDFRGRTDKAQIPPFLYDKLTELFSSIMFEDLYPETSMTIYGEGYGARIQKGGGDYISNGVSFIAFDVMIDGVWLERHNVEDIADKLHLDVVPIVGMGTLEEAVELVRQGFRSIVAEKWMNAEGLVMRPSIELQTRLGHRIVTKIKHKDFGRSPSPG